MADGKAGFMKMMSKKYEVEDLDVQIARHKPESLDMLCQSTNFSRKELQMMYRGFKQGCPTGIVSWNQFKEIYSEFFPQGDPGKYAKFVFQTFDTDGDGQINFEEFVNGISTLSRGDLNEKISWIFKLYDIHNQGQITRDELINVISAIYEMMGNSHVVSVESNQKLIAEHANYVFEKMDKDKDGIITKSEFLHTCLKDPSICQTLHIFDTTF
uniref:EF-hand domain-containing protein n=1 Tax=Romanomermis culicivorax TaxID=13658 RepID=A0A915K770_ROMCU